MKRIVLMIAALAVFYNINAQNNAKDVFTTEEIVWYGLDFSKAKLIGQFDQGAGVNAATGSDIKTKYIPAWNMLIVNEWKKYNLGKVLRKNNVINDISAVEKSNSTIDVDNIMSYNDYKFEDANATVKKIVSRYGKVEKNSGIGLVFIVESFNKSAERSTIYVTFFDIASKKIIFTEKMTGKPMGFGLRNFWAGSIKNILNQIDQYDYKTWKNNYDK